MPASSCARSSAYMRDSPSEAASRPGASGARSGRAVSAPRTMVASRRSGSVAEAELLDHDVEGAELAAMAPEHALALDVEGRRPEPLGDARHLGRARRTGTRRSGSTKRRISQGQAMRSTLGRARVTQTVRPCASRGGSLASGTMGSPAVAQPSAPPSSDFGRDAVVPQPGGDALAELQPLLADHDRGRPAPANSAAHSATCRKERRTAPGIRRGSAGEILVRPDVDEGRARRAVPIRRASLSGEMVLRDGHADASLLRAGRDAWACRLVGRSRSP